MKKINVKNMPGNLLLTGFIFIVFLAFTPVEVMADSDDMLRERIERLEKELRELKAMIKEKKDRSGDVSAEKKSGAPAPGPSGDYSIKPYGYVKLDASYDDSAVTNGNFVILVPSEGTKKDDDEFNITARQTRIGMDITGPEISGMKTKAKAEIDFYGDGPVAHETKPEPFLRHAYLEISRNNVSYLAGQTWDVVSPLNPSTLNYPVGWAAGNIGYRRPQFRISCSRTVSDSLQILAQFALSRTTGLTNEDLDGGGQNDGDDSGFPTMQGRIAFTAKGAAGNRSVIGISGHYGQEEADWAGAVKDLTSWSGNIDFSIPISGSLTLKGEAFMGENLDDYFGGVLQGVNTVTRNEISSAGMWSQLSFNAGKSWKYNAGFGFDNPDYNDINNGMRDKNSFYFINTMYTILPKLTIGLEYSHWETEYKNLPEGDDNRLQTSVILAW